VGAGPRAFTVVMATGILGAAAAGEGLTWVGDVLGAVGGAVWAVVLAASAAHPDGWTGGPGSGGLAFVAGTDVLAARAGGWLGVALWCAALAAWAVVALTSARAVRRRRGLGDGEHGGWLIVAALLAHARRGLRAEDLRGEHWIAMGALAISALASASLGAAASRSGWTGVSSALGTPTLVLWIAATAWIPVLVGLELWRARRAPGPWRYSASRWSTVFPLGMYATATHAVAMRLALPALRPVAAVAFGVAAVVWAAAALGLARRARRRASRLRGGSLRRGFGPGGGTEARGGQQTT
jgi:tellurite resistance protein TehA-like permease